MIFSLIASNDFLKYNSYTHLSIQELLNGKFEKGEMKKMQMHMKPILTYLDHNGFRYPHDYFSILKKNQFSKKNIANLAIKIQLHLYDKRYYISNRQVGKANFNFINCIFTFYTIINPYGVIIILASEFGKKSHIYIDLDNEIYKVHEPRLSNIQINENQPISTIQLDPNDQRDLVTTQSYELPDFENQDTIHFCDMDEDVYFL